MARCCGNFARGVPGDDGLGGCFSGCCKKTCPPPNCCPTVTIKYECGSPRQFDFPQGCAGTAAIAASTSNIEVNYEVPNPLLENEEDDLPTFKQHSVLDPDNDVVFALAACSIPCVDVTVTLSIVSGACCFDVVGNSIFMVGSGVITASVSPASDSPIRGSGCGLFNVTINGSNPPVSVSDGSGVGVSVSAPFSNPPGCCPCNQQSVTNPCASSLYVLKGNKVTLNKTEILRQVNHIRKIKIAEKIRKLRG